MDAQCAVCSRVVLAAGDAYALDAGTSTQDAYAYWYSEALATHVAELGGRVAGLYRLVEDQPGRGSHVANASLAVDPEARGQGVGLALGQHCLARARELGFLAMQFNLVVGANGPAVALWRKLGFAIVGTLPRAFRHARLGPVDAHVMYRAL